MMSKNFIRKPFGNFFLKKSLQMRLIIKIVIAVLISTLVTSATLLMTYIIKFGDTAFYRVLLGETMDIGPREDIANIIWPSLVASALVNLLVAVGIGFYASRKYAVPVYKLEQWADLLKDGKMTAKLRFREKEEFRDLSSHCNELSEKLRKEFLKIKGEAAAIIKEHPDLVAAKNIDAVVKNFELDAMPIEVNTSYYRLQDVQGAQADPTSSSGV
ncbi:MAG: hypothetical protein GF398_09830 [Chitinivibrionales bacterium]|nr:hypothetical protein [Chitinivibrionales bacterium]